MANDSDTQHFEPEKTPSAILVETTSTYFGLHYTSCLFTFYSFDYWMKSFVAFQETTENARMKKSQDVQNGCPHGRNVAA